MGQFERGPYFPVTHLEWSGMESYTRIYAAVGLAAVVAIYLVISGTWPFDPVPIRLSSSPSLWQLLLADRLTRGFLRLAIVAVTGYLVASIVALVAQNRWITRFSSSGLSTEEAGKAAKTVERLEEQLDQLTNERDQLLRLLDVDSPPKEGTMLEQGENGGSE